MPVNSDIQVPSPSLFTNTGNPSLRAQVQAQRAQITAATHPDCALKLMTFFSPLELYNAVTPPDDPWINQIRRRRESWRESEKTFFDFLWSLLAVFLGTIGYLILLAFYYIIPIAMIIIGERHLHDCPQQKYIPLLLLVGGGFMIIQDLVKLAVKALFIDGGYVGSLILCLLYYAVACFFSVWLITITVLVYKEYKPYYSPALAKYCDKTLYLFAFWLITSHYICAVFIIMCVCSCLCCSVLANITL